MNNNYFHINNSCTLIETALLSARIIHRSCYIWLLIVLLISINYTSRILIVSILVFSWIIQRWCFLRILLIVVVIHSIPEIESQRLIKFWSRLLLICLTIFTENIEKLSLDISVIVSIIPAIDVISLDYHICLN